LLQTAPIAAPTPGTQLVSTLGWNNLIDLLEGNSAEDFSSKNLLIEEDLALLGFKITTTGGAQGNLLKHDATGYDDFALGAANTALVVNSGATDLVYALIADANIASHTSTKITINAKGQLNSNIVYTDQLNVFGDFNQTFKDNRILIESPDGLTPVTIINAQQTLARNVTIPILSANGDFVITGLANQITDTELTAGAFPKITGVGTIASGTWEGTDIANAFIANLPVLGTLPASPRQLNIVNAEIDAGAAIVQSKLVNVVDADIDAHTSTKITITAKGQLNSAIVYTDQINTFGAFLNSFAASTMRIPLAAAPTMAVDGDFAIDTSITDFTMGLIKYFDGEEMAVVAMPIAELTTPIDGDAVTYNAATDEFELRAPAGGAAHDILSATHSDAATATRVEGDVLFSDATQWNRLPRGTDNQALVATATTVGYESLTLATHVSGASTDLTDTGVIVRTNQLNDFGDFDQTFLDNRLLIERPAGGGINYTIQAGAIAAARILNLPVITGTDTLVVLGLAQAYGAGVKQTFIHDATNAGIRINEFAGDPGTLVDGDIWLNLTSNTLFARINGANVDLGAGAGGGEANTLASLGGGTVLTAAVPKSGVQLQTVSIATTAPLTHSTTTDLMTFDINDLVNADISATAAIVLTKLQNINTDRLLGRETAAAGAIEEITLNATLELVSALTLQRAALTGDVTSPAGSNALTYNPGSIISADINASAAITLAQLANMNTARLLGRNTAAAGVIEELTIGASLNFDTLNLERAALTGDVTAPLDSNTTTVANVPDGALSANVVLETIANTYGAFLQNLAAASMRIPNSDTASVTVDGDIAFDNLVTDFTTGVLRIFGSGEEQGVVAMPITQFTAPTGGNVVSYNATTDEFELVAAGAADNLGNHIATETLKMVDQDILAVPTPAADFFAITTEIISGDDTGTEALAQYVVRLDTPAVVATRPLFSWFNNTTKELEIENDGTLNLQNNNLTVGTGFIDLTEIATPPNPAAQVVRLFAIDINGKTQLAFQKSGGETVTFQSGATQFVAASDSDSQSFSKADQVCNGTNDEVQIAAAIAALPAIGGEVVLSEGNFSIGAIIQLNLAANNHITIRGRGTTTSLNTTAGFVAATVFNVAGHDNNIFRDFQIDMSATTTNGLEAITLNVGVQEILIDNVTFESATGSAILVNSGADARLKITNCTFLNSGEAGILVTGSTTHVQITNNYFRFWAQNVAANKGISLVGSKNCVISNNILIGEDLDTAGEMAISCFNQSHRNTISGNTILNSNSDAIAINDSTNCVVIGNTVEGGQDVGISLQDAASECSIIGNTIFDTRNTCISVAVLTGINMVDAIIQGNNCDKTNDGVSGRDGITVATAGTGTIRNVTITGNSISSVLGDGILLSLDVDNVLVSNNGFGNVSGSDIVDATDAGNTDIQIFGNNADFGTEFNTDGITAGTRTILSFIQTVDRTITFPDATDTLMGKLTVDVMTNKSYDLGGAGNVLTGSVAEFNTALQSETFAYIGVANAWGTLNQNIAATGKWQEAGIAISTIGTHDIFLDAKALKPLTTGGAAAIADEELGAAGHERMVEYMLFAVSNSEHATGRWVFPQNWDAGTVDIEICFYSSTVFAAAGTVRWVVRMTAVDEGGVLTTNYPADTNIDVTPGVDTVKDIHFSAFTTITIGDTPSKGDLIFMDIERAGDDGADDHTGDARLISVRIRPTIDAATAT